MVPMHGPPAERQVGRHHAEGPSVDVASERLVLRHRMDALIDETGSPLHHAGAGVPAAMYQDRVYRRTCA